MSSNLDTRILLLADKEVIMAFETERLKAEVSDTMEREMRSWDARWRAEALEHYLPQGWSFASYLNGQLVGYFLGQPYLFHRGLTQTLWMSICLLWIVKLARTWSTPLIAGRATSICRPCFWRITPFRNLF